MLSGLTDALDKGRRDFGITAKLIMCFLRHLPEEQAFDTVLPWLSEERCVQLANECLELYCWDRLGVDN